MNDSQPVAETPAPAQPDVETSLADHEQAFLDGRQSSPTASDAEPAPQPESQDADADADSARDDKGRFTKPRHRAQSQQASAEDVPRIRELTRRLRETEAQLEEARRPRQSAPAAESAPATPPAPKPAGFPSFEQWAAQPENKDKAFEDFIDARADYRYEQRRAAERAEEAQTAAARAQDTAVSAYLEQLPAVLKDYPDFNEIVNPAEGPIQVSKVVERAVLLAGPRTAYYLATHPDECDALSGDTVMDPTAAGFDAAVKATKRYLLSLVADGQRPSSPSRAAAASTGSALALVAPTTPRPPNPVRTGAMRDGEQPPSDEGSLADHEKAYAPGRRRA